MFTQSAISDTAFLREGGFLYELLFVGFVLPVFSLILFLAEMLNNDLVQMSRLGR